MMTVEIRPEIDGNDVYCLCDCPQWDWDNCKCKLQKREQSDPPPFMCIVWYKRRIEELKVEVEHFKDEAESWMRHVQKITKV